MTGTQTGTTPNRKNEAEDVRPTYRIEMVFSLDVSDPIINRMTARIDGSHPVLMNALTCSLELSRQGIPSAEELAEYEQAVKTAYTTDRMHVDAVRFLHYASVREL